MTDYCNTCNGTLVVRDGYDGTAPCPMCCCEECGSERVALVCPHCQGKKLVDGQPCVQCFGRGYNTGCHHCEGLEVWKPDHECFSCHKNMHYEKCEECGGTGYDERGINECSACGCYGGWWVCECGMMEH